jgi:hypothetical protein
VKNNLFSSPNTARFNESRKTRMGWSFGKTDDKTVKKIFLGKPDGRRNAGRPKLRWLGCVENDLKSMGVKRWRKKADDRSVWAVILKEALVTIRTV